VNGAKEMRGLGRRLRSYFPELLGEVYYPRRYNIVSSQVSFPLRYPLTVPVLATIELQVASTGPPASCKLRPFFIELKACMASYFTEHGRCSVSERQGEGCDSVCHHSLRNLNCVDLLYMHAGGTYCSECCCIRANMFW
jgi:hypothetical protein